MVKMGSFRDEFAERIRRRQAALGMKANMLASSAFSNIEIPEKESGIKPLESLFSSKNLTNESIIILKEDEDPYKGLYNKPSKPVAECAPTAPPAKEPTGGRAEVRPLDFGHDYRIPTTEADVLRLRQELRDWRLKREHDIRMNPFDEFDFRKPKKDFDPGMMPAHDFEKPHGDKLGKMPSAYPGLEGKYKPSHLRNLVPLESLAELRHSSHLSELRMLATEQPEKRFNDIESFITTPAPTAPLAYAILRYVAAIAQSPYRFTSVQDARVASAAMALVTNPAFAESEAIALTRSNPLSEDFYEAALNRYARKVVPALSALTSYNATNLGIEAVVERQPKIRQRDALEEARRQVDKVNFCEKQVRETLGSANLQFAYANAVAQRAEQIARGIAPYSCRCP